MSNGKRFFQFAGQVVGRKACLVAAVAAVGLTSVSARAAAIYNVDSAPTIVDQWTIGQPTTINHETVTPGALYSNQTTFSGYGVRAGTNGTAKFTALIADDINTTSATNFLLGQFSWSVSNGATTAQTISPYIRFYAADGTGGAPGTLLGGLNFNGISVAAGSVAGFYYDATASAITLPPSFWAAEFFSTTSSAANAAKIGVGTFNPPDVGTSADEDFTSSTYSTSSSSFVSASPAGTVNSSPFVGTPVANFEWEFNPAVVVATPEPTTVLAIAPIAMAILGRRRRAV